LADALGNLIDSVEYADGAPWPEEADGDGFYLELIDVLADNSIASNWKASADGVLSTTDFNTLPVDFSVYPNPTAAELHINAARILQKIEIYNPLGQQIKTVKVNLKSVTLNISDLKKGMYLLNLKFIDGTRATTKIFKK
jgi:hypothetical protein